MNELLESGIVPSDSMSIEGSGLHLSFTIAAASKVVHNLDCETSLSLLFNRDVASIQKLHMSLSLFGFVTPVFHPVWLRHCALTMSMTEVAAVS